MDAHTGLKDIAEHEDGRGTGSVIQRRREIRMIRGAVWKSGHTTIAVYMVWEHDKIKEHTSKS